MSNWEHFQALDREVNSLHARGRDLGSDEMIEAYIRRNLFGFEPEKKIHRIFPNHYLEADIRQGVITLPLASPKSWKDPLENPLSSVAGVDEITNSPLDYGNLVRPFYALCWTHRESATSGDWLNFSHGKPATRITTSARKLIRRFINTDDRSYMNRAWLVQVEYSEEQRIKDLQTVVEVSNRMESTGARLALSAATVRCSFRDEDEVRLLYDTSLPPLPSGVKLDESGKLVRIPFDWDDFIEQKEGGPFH